MGKNDKQEAKDWIENKIAISFGSDYVGTSGGKIYINGKTKSGEKIQIALSMTCPSTPIEIPSESVSTGFDWSDPPTPVTESVISPDKEKINLDILLSALGL